MIKRTRLWALLGSSALLLGMLLASTGGVAADGQVAWDGQQGLTNGTFKDTQCATPPVGFIHWVFTDGGGTVTAASITFGGSGSGTFAMSQNGQGSWSYDSAFFTLATLTASVSYTGTVGQGANLVISDGCPGETQSQPPSEAPSATPTEGIPTATPTFNLQTGDITDAPSEPSTDAAVGTNGTSAPADGAWLLVVALGVLLASIVVLTPARAKSRR